MDDGGGANLSAFIDPCTHTNPKTKGRFYGQTQLGHHVVETVQDSTYYLRKIPFCFVAAALARSAVARF